MALEQSPKRPYNVLFLCTGNSARSILGEAILNKIGADKFVAHSAGSRPKGQVHASALILLRRLGYPTEALRSKNWDVFAAEDAPRMDFIFTVCDDAANEVCPVWPGQPITAHWGLPDPAAVEGTDAKIMAAFRDAFDVLKRRIELFTNLPVQTLDRISLQARLRAIGSAAVHEIRQDDAAFRNMLAALRAADLPTSDLGEGETRYFVLGDSDAFGAMTSFGPVGLLRSVVVPDSKRGHGKGAQLVREVLAQAKTAGIRETWLLTTGAAPFFAKLGFAEVNRGSAPADIAATFQFRDLCPSSATLMRKQLA